MIKFLKRLIHLFKNQDQKKEYHDSKSIYSSPIKSETSSTQQFEIIQRRVSGLKKIRDLLRNKNDELKLKGSLLNSKQIRFNKAISNLREYHKKTILLKNGINEENSNLSVKLEKAEIEITNLSNITNQYLNDIIKLKQDNEVIQLELENEKGKYEKLSRKENLSDKKNDDNYIKINKLKNLVRYLEDQMNQQLKDIELKPQQVKELLARIMVLNESALSFEEWVSELQKPATNVVRKGLSVELSSDEDITLNKPLDSDLSGETDTHIVEKAGELSDDHSSIDPINRGGRTRISNGSKDKNEYEQTEHIYKPKIVCWKEDWIWKLGIEIPEELNDDGLSVYQNSKKLIINGSKENCYDLNDIKHDVIVKPLSKREWKVETSAEGFLLFKLNSNKSDEGVRVKCQSYGTYLAIVSNQWAYNEELSGSLIAEPEKVNIPGLSAYYFHFEKESLNIISFINLNDEIKSIGKLHKFFHLKGKILEDNSKTYGPLFGEQLPDIILSDEVLNLKIGCVVMGEEGFDRRGFKQKISTFIRRDTIKLSNSFPNILSGWYFLRFYDEEDELVDSCDFRFISSLYNIEFKGIEQIPAENGHSEIHIYLFHDSDFMMQLKSTHNNIRIDKSEKLTSVSIPVDPCIEDLKFICENINGRKVELIFPIERIWWSISDDIPKVWQDKTIVLHPTDFYNLSNSLFIKFPSGGWTTDINFGFLNKELRAYPVSLETKILKIPLFDFSDAEQEMNSLGRFLLTFILPHLEETLIFSPCELLVKSKCKFCSDYFTTDMNELIMHLFDYHNENIFSEPIYSEIQQLIPDLPKKIFKCSHCPEYVSSFSRYPEDIIYHHLQIMHSREIRLFSVVDDLNEIRSFVINHLPHFKKCKMCNKVIRESDCYEHLKENHIKEVIVKEKKR